MTLQELLTETVETPSIECWDDENFSFIRHDVTEFVHVGGDLDWVIHLASLVSPVFYQRHPFKTLKVGALGTHKTLGLAKEISAGYLFASTSEVYGDPEVNPQPESYRGNVDSYGPRSCYDESKRYGESLIRAYHDEHGLDLVGTESDVVYEPLPPQDPTVRRPDITKAKTELDWSPTVDLDDGLRESIEYFEETL